MLLFIKDSNLPRAKFSPGLSATLLQWTVLLNLGQVPLKYCKWTEKWEVLLLGRFFWGEGFFPLSRFFFLGLVVFFFLRRTASGIYKEKKKKKRKRQQDPKDGNYEEGGDAWVAFETGSTAAVAQALFALLLTAVAELLKW